MKFIMYAFIAALCAIFFGAVLEHRNEVEVDTFVWVEPPEIAQTIVTSTVQKGTDRFRIECGDDTFCDYTTFDIEIERFTNKRTFTIYNAGVEAQTYEDACIGAAGVDICMLIHYGVNVFACNDIPLGEIIEVEGIGVGIVLDRMNGRYVDGECDWAWNEKLIDEALDWGRRELKTSI